MRAERQEERSKETKEEAVLEQPYDLFEGVWIIRLGLVHYVT